MDQDRETRPLDDLRQPPDEFVARLKQTGRPVTLTVDGRDELVVQDAASYQKLRELAERLETIEAVRAGLASADRGEGRPLDDAFDTLEAEFRPRARA